MFRLRFWRASTMALPPCPLSNLPPTTFRLCFVFVFGELASWLCLPVLHPISFRGYVVYVSFSFFSWSRCNSVIGCSNVIFLGRSRFCFVFVPTHKKMFPCNWLDWTGLIWSGLSTTGANWTGVHWTGLRWASLDRAWVDWTELTTWTRLGEAGWSKIEQR